MGKVSRTILGTVLLVLLSALFFGYLSSIAFITIYKKGFTIADFRDVGLFKTYEYAQAYWGDRYVRLRLIGAWAIAGVAAGLPLLGMFALALKKLLAGESMFGDARFADRFEIKESGLLGDDGIIVGKIGNRYLMFGGQQFVLLYAPTRSGKGVSTVVPNLLNWNGSVVVLDVKPELWRLTSGYRKKHGQECFMFAPLTNETHCWNPFFYVSTDPNMRITDIQQIAEMFVPDQAGTDRIWTASPRRLFLGVALYLQETPEIPFTIGELLRQLSTAEDTASYFARVITERENSDTPLSYACKQNLLSFIGVESEKTRSGIKESLTSALDLWANPAIDAATSKNDFDLRDLRRKPMSVYLCLTVDKLAMLAPLINLFFQQLIALNTQVMPADDPTLKHKCLLLLDEFPAIGKVPIVAKSNAFIAGFDLRLLTICQSPSQIREIYGQEAAESFFDNHALELVFATKNNKIRREISEKLGMKTVKQHSYSRPLFGGRGSQSYNESEASRALVLPQEITELGFENEIILFENVKPIRAKKVVYWKDKNFQSRLTSPASVPKLDLSDVTRRQAQLSAAFAGQVVVANGEAEPGDSEAPAFVDVNAENIAQVMASAQTISVADLDFPDELQEQLPDSVASEEEVDELVKLFLSEAEAA